MAFLALRIIFRFARPYIMKFIMRKLERKINNTMGFNPEYEEPKKQSKRQKDGNVIIDKVPESTNRKGDTSNLGEYVDYEEIE